MQIPWLEPLVESWQSSGQQGRQAHALMLTGIPGTGKRAAAAWCARRRLGIGRPSDLPEFPWTVPEHADLHWVQPAEGKHSIGVEQIRGLVAALGLTSYEGGSKVAIVEPADAMTNSAANSLLKTLEEPPGDTLIVLVVDRPGRLPATIYSRCQRMHVRAPAEHEGLRWLQGLQAATNWPKALAMTGNAPLAALAARERIDDAEAMAQDFTAVAEGRAAPLAVAARWAKSEPEMVLGWLGRQVQRCISRIIAGSAAQAGDVNDSVLARIDRRNLFCYLDLINRLRGQPAGSFNVQLTFECLLIDWADGLQSVSGTEI